MEKETKLTEILTDLYQGSLGIEESQKQILLLFGVSGNEANPQKIKSGEVALPTERCTCHYLNEYNDSGICQGCGKPNRRQ